MLINIKTGQWLNEFEFNERLDIPWGDSMFTDENLRPRGYALLNMVYPGHVPVGMKHVPDGGEERDGKWYSKYKAIPYDEADLTAFGSSIQSERNRLLTESDWTRLDDAGITEEHRAQWATYRQQLRDVTNQQGYPLSVEWPTRPTL